MIFFQWKLFMNAKKLKSSTTDIIVTQNEQIYNILQCFSLYLAWSSKHFVNLTENVSRVVVNQWILYWTFKNNLMKEQPNEASGWPQMKRWKQPVIERVPAIIDFVATKLMNLNIAPAEVVMISDHTTNLSPTNTSLIQNSWHGVHQHQ